MYTCMYVCIYIYIYNTYTYMCMQCGVFLLLRVGLLKPCSFIICGLIYVYITFMDTYNNIPIYNHIKYMYIYK